MLAVSPVVGGTDVGQAVGLAAMLRLPRGAVQLPAGRSLVPVVWEMAAGPIGVVPRRGVCPGLTLIRPGL